MPKIRHPEQRLKTASKHSLWPPGFSRVKKLTVAAAVSGAAAASVIWGLGTALIAPQLHPVARPPDFDAESVHITGPGHAIAGWWSDAGERQPVVLLLHGIRADRASMVSRARLLQLQGFSALLIDLQAHGETPGGEITLGWREAADVDAALEWISQRRPGSPVGVVGCSLGGAAFLYSSERAKPAAIVLEAVYPRAREAIENRLRARFGAAAPFLAPLLTMQLPLRMGVTAEQLEPIRYASELKGAVLVIAGRKDRYTTLAESRELYESMPQPRDMWIVEDAGHQDFLARDPAGYQTHAISFLRAHLQESKREGF
jgi:pimeloyl-ACP methyl ester carboxylesterase